MNFNNSKLPRIKGSVGGGGGSLLSVSIVLPIFFFATLAFATLPQALPLPLLNPIFAIAERSLERRRMKLHNLRKHEDAVKLKESMEGTSADARRALRKEVQKNAELDEDASLKQNRRILVDLFRELAVFNGLFVVLAFFVHVGTDYSTVLEGGRFVNGFPPIQIRDVDPRLAPEYLHADGSQLSFLAATKVDTARMGSFAGVGGGTSYGGRVYCAAPIRYPGAGKNEVETSDGGAYWAVGVDCCTGEGHFWCGDVRKEGPAGYYKNV